jgi:hypothetical protein
MNKPRFLICEVEGNVIVQLRDQNNHILVNESLDEGEDPYEYIMNLRSCADEADVTEKPAINFTDGL